MALKLDLTDKRFGRWVVIKESLPKRHRYVEYLCRCDCGNEKIVKAGHLTGGRSTSCGCFQRENASRIHSTHGLVNTKEYKIWCGIKRRCLNKKDASYSRYGREGIRMCERWANSFECFLKDMGTCPEGMDSIDRIDNNKGYEKNNCRWANSIIQANNRNSNVFFVYRGERDTLANLCRKYKKPYKFVWRRVKSGLTIEDALTIPIQKVGGPGILYYKKRGLLSMRSKPQKTN